MYHTEKEWERLFREMGAFWRFSYGENGDVDPKRYHAELTGGDHTDQVFKADVVLQDPIIGDRIASDLVEYITKERHIAQPVYRIVAPAMGAITFGNDLARHFSIAQGRVCLFSFAMKHEAGNMKEMIFPRMAPNENEIVLVAEDVITSGTTVDRVARAAREEKASVWGYVVCILNRSDSDRTPDGRSIISLVDRPMPLWKQNACPLCKAGSKTIRPKGVDNWRLLNAVY